MREQKPYLGTACDLKCLRVIEGFWLFLVSPLSVKILLWNSQNYQLCAKKKLKKIREGMPTCFYHNFRIKNCRAEFVIITDVVQQ